MANPLYPFYGNQNGGPFPFNMIQRFNEFRQNFTGDPKEKVQDLLNSGQMTQEQFSQLSFMAQEFQQLLNK